ncbi:hypothetical protein AKJ62_04440 [candidate division MSBL1 archaeon SCGC-AAA259D14]|uniref:Uncharacterized protein n=3 Tax=candidate division MSBL1 TaxID=215777 RepID=A0A133U3P1_9EURY|nr:hypothetical protein AKJ62_04440 [candidate division MSBL1 archaeon SCGC-AAA259D14]KXA89760.1 hypothetical protein AKJ61_02160 [candidate division MSBL1 archaeon SCGC-AAA259B11]KXA96364.1 hypothetical protein AKJ39_04705 [candidate division MSBL1 archaeon SCGC-AAA259J03]
MASKHGVESGVSRWMIFCRLKGGVLKSLGKFAGRMVCGVLGAVLRMCASPVRRGNFIVGGIGAGIVDELLSVPPTYEQ